MSTDDEIRRLRAQGMGMLDVSKRLNVSLSRVAAVAKQKPAPVTPFADAAPPSALSRCARRSPSCAQSRLR